MLDTVTQKFSALFRKRADANKIDSAAKPDPHSIATKVNVESAQTPNGSNRSEIGPAGKTRRRSHRKKRPTESLETASSGTDFFGDLPVSSSLAKALSQVGYVAPTPIQQAVIPSVSKGLDVVGQAQTGTGKTAAFGIPLSKDYQELSLDRRKGLIKPPYQPSPQLQR